MWLKLSNLMCLDLAVKRKIEKHREKVLRVDSVLQKNQFVKPVPSSILKKCTKNHNGVSKMKDANQDGHKVSKFHWCCKNFVAVRVAQVWIMCLVVKSCLDKTGTVICCSLSIPNLILNLFYLHFFFPHDLSQDNSDLSGMFDIWGDKGTQMFITFKVAFLFFFWLSLWDV